MQKALSIAVPIPCPRRMGSTATGPRCQCGSDGSRRAHSPTQFKMRTGVVIGLPIIAAGSTLNLFDHIGLAEARACHSTDPNESVRTNGTKNKPSPIDTFEYRHEKKSHGYGTAFAVRDTEHCHVRGIVTHSSTHKLSGLFKFIAAQQAQHERVAWGHRRPPRMRLLSPVVHAKPHSSRNQYSVRPSKEKPMNPRTLNFFPPSFTVIEHLYIFPLSGSRISPPVRWPPSFVRSQTIRRPTRRRSLRSPEHRTQRGSGSFGSGRSTCRSSRRACRFLPRYLQPSLFSL